MQKFTTKILTLSLAATGFISFPSDAGSFKVDPQSRFGKKLQKVHHVRESKVKNTFFANDAKLNPFGTRGGQSRVAVKDPDFSVTNVPTFSYLDGPDGNKWFYTIDYEYETRVTIPEFDYEEDVISAFKVSVYDGSFTKIGEISDKIDYAENETRCVLVEIDPTVSLKFFNSDDKPEIMCYIAKNTVEYENNTCYKVYSLGGEKDAEGHDKSIATLEGRLVDTVNLAAADGEEDFYFTFVSDSMVDLDADYDSFVDFLNSYYYRLTTYSRAVDDSGIKEVFSHDIYCSRVPGDTTDGIFFISKNHEGSLYLIYSQYDKPYFIDPTGMSDDERATPDNSLGIEVYAVEKDGVRKVSDTSIPVETFEQPGALIYTYLSIGSVAWTHDIDMKVNGTPEAPAFIVALDLQNAALYEEYVSSRYDIYGADGKLIRNLASGTDGITLFAEDSDSQPQVMFIYAREDESYDFEFVNLYGGDKLFKIDQNNNDDPISSRCDRVKQKDGSYKYAFEMTYYDADDEGNEYIRVAWFDENGSFERIDRINVGENVMAAQVNMGSSILNPNLFDNDDEMEYAVMVKRDAGDRILTEFLIVDNDGKRYATFSEDDNKGIPYSVGVVFGEVNKLMTIYYHDFTDYNIDLYDIPFDNLNPDFNGIEEIETPSEGVKEKVSYYNLQGMKVDSPTKGVYIRVLDGKASKILVK